MYKNKPGPRNPSSSFKLFCTDKMMKNIVQNTKKNMQPVIDNCSNPLDGSTKYSHVKTVDRIDIKAFICILHLRGAFRLNIHYREVIWNHESQLARNIPEIFAECFLSVAMFETSREQLANILKEKKV